jgi:Sulfotransferase family
MNNQINQFKSRWQPQPRPEWVQCVNNEGQYLDIASIVPLDEESLLNAAMATTGLSDFGDDQWREPFRILLKSLNEDARLNLMGRLMTRSDLLNTLQARLQVEDVYKRYPEIAGQEINRPLIIVGQGRSGTSFLQGLLASHPDNGTLTHWEETFPCPPPEAAHYARDPRIARSHQLITQWNRVAPEYATMHEVGGAVPFECCQVMAMSFMAQSWFDALGQVSAYDEFIAGQDPVPALEYHKRVLKLLQWKNPRQHWVLKDPMHLDRLPAMLKVYPDACFIWPHRDPVRALASMVNLVGTLQWMRSDYPFQGMAFEYMTDPVISANRFNAVIEHLENGVVPRDRVANLLYKDLVADPITAVSSIYDHFELPLGKPGIAAMKQYLLDNARDNRPRHRFNAGSDAMISDARRAYRHYQDYFSVPSE